MSELLFMPIFEPFSKIPRFHREVVVTEKIDGTNAQVFIQEYAGYSDSSPLGKSCLFSRNIGSEVSPHTLYVFAGSRNRWLSLKDDNFGFARWVYDNADELVELGPGHHYGEWWGRGIQRGYGLDEKRFSLFNTHRWADDRPSCCGVVPVLWSGVMDQAVLYDILRDLGSNGSKAAPGYKDPEGIIIYHTHAQSYFKITLKDDEKGKGG